MKGFINYISNFMEKAKLVPSSGNVVVALSGGRDSMGLLHVAFRLKEEGLIKRVRAFHVNHGTRVENEKEEELVTKYCRELEVPLLVFHPMLKPELSNFEHFAREKRYELFFKNLLEGEVLLTAHHIDDSFEWSLLKQFKSGSSNTLGIPVKNGRIYRPFNCVTKKQITRYVKINKIPFNEDSSNDSLRFERNFIRKKVIPEISARFPGYLKHYVSRSNQLAIKRGVSSLVERKTKFNLLKDKQGILITHPDGSNDFRGAEEQIIEAITLLSETKRGTLHKQVEKIIQAAKNGKKGPLLFSGNVLGFINLDSLYFMNKSSLEDFKKLDEKLLSSLQNNLKFKRVKLKEEYPRGLTFPFLTFAKGMPKNIPSLKKEHPLFPKSTEFAIENGLWVNTLPRLLSQGSKGRDYLIFDPTTIGL